jgi:hypothetical protein
MFGLHLLKRAFGGAYPPTFVTKRHDDNLLEAPLGEGSGEAPPKRNFLKDYLVKYCNFVVNLNHSSLGYKYDGRSYVRFFFS